jgi:hypothetical protein
MFGIILQIIRAANSPDFGEFLLVTSFYFTTQTNILLTVTSLFFIIKFHNKNWYKYLIFITLINVLITAIVFHVLLAPYMENVDLIQQVLHTINPLLFIIFYFVFYGQNIAIKKVWICLIYPLIYLLNVYLIIEPIFGNLMEFTMPNFNSARYVYPFLDPQTYTSQWLGLWLFILGIIAPFTVLISSVSIWLKQKANKKITNLTTKKA